MKRKNDVNVSAGLSPPLDHGFRPTVVWNHAYQARVDAAGDAVDVEIALERGDGTCYRHATRMLAPSPASSEINTRYLERTLKFLLWQQGGARVSVAGCDPATEAVAAMYRAGADRSFDAGIMGRIFGTEMVITCAAPGALPPEHAPERAVGRHLDGCRIGFDLGGSDRKCAAVIDGEVVFSHEEKWDPYFQSDPRYHIEGIQNSLERAAAHLPRVDAIGGSAAGLYVNNEVRLGSLYRGIADNDFERHIRPMFGELRRRWGGVPFEVANDGDVTALAGFISLGRGAVLGISMGTSQAGGYCTREGRLTGWLNELAFAPVDCRPDAPVDEWSGDHGCGVQYFSQQAVARLAPAAGLAFDASMPLPERLEAVQDRMGAGDERARAIFETIGVYLGYAVALYADFYSLDTVLLLGRVTSAEGGTTILAAARRVLEAEFANLAERIVLTMPDETFKRHGQAIAAASLPALEPRKQGDR